MGKSLGDDLREGKATLPLIVAMQRGNTEQQTIIQEAIETGNLAQLDVILSVVRETGALDASREAAAAEAQRAIDALNNIAPSQYKDALLQLASQLLIRRS
jgi:octaprenyl-diphosphate synthase